MHYNFRTYDINTGLPRLAGRILARGEETGSRNGACKELTHVGVTYQMPWQREILLPDRKANIAAQIAETMWVLAGRNDIEFLSHYLPRAKDFSDDGRSWRAGYGPRLRAWNGSDGFNVTDQLAEVIRILREDPMSRRAVMSIFDPAEDYTDSKDIPCNNWITFSSRLGKLDMHVAVRSNDLIWGHSGINYFEWSALQEIVAGMLGVQIGALHFSITSLHIYAPHWEKAQKISRMTYPRYSEQLTDSPRFDATGLDDTTALDYLLDQWFAMEERIRTSTDVSMFAKIDSDISDFPEPMMRSWLRVLRWWWTGDRTYLDPIKDTRLEHATQVSLQPPTRLVGENVVTNYPQKVARAELSAVQTPDRGIVGWAYNPTPSKFLRNVFDLHLEKHKAYGDSWKRRGELFSIIPNIARKIDRLVTGSETSDETATDTAIDLMVYLGKYRDWIDGPDSTDPGAANLKMLEAEIAEPTVTPLSDRERVGVLTNMFEMLLNGLEVGDRSVPLVDAMLVQAYELARHRWESAFLAPGGYLLEDEYRADLNQ